MKKKKEQWQKNQEGIVICLLWFLCCALLCLNWREGLLLLSHTHWHLGGPCCYQSQCLASNSFERRLICLDPQGGLDLRLVSWGGEGHPCNRPTLSGQPTSGAFRRIVGLKTTVIFIYRRLKVFFCFLACSSSDRNTLLCPTFEVLSRTSVLICSCWRSSTTMNLEV